MSSVDGKAYVIATNLENKEMTINESHTGIGYATNGTMKDIKDGTIKGKINDDRIEITIPAYGYVVLEVVPA